MASNPYVTVPGGPAWMQQLWLRSYLQNQDLQTRLNLTRPNPWASVLTGAAKGLDTGLTSYFDTQDRNYLLGQQTSGNLMLQAARDQAAQQAQQAMLERLIEQSNLEESRKLRESTFRGLATQAVLSRLTPSMGPGPDVTRTDVSGGAEPPAVAQGVEAPPPSYATDVTTAGPPTLQPGLSLPQAIAGLPPTLAGLISQPEMLKELTALSQTGPSPLKVSEYTGLLTAYREGVANGTIPADQARADFVARTGVDINFTEPPALQEQRLKAGLQQKGLAGQIPGVTPEGAAATVGGFGGLLQNQQPKLTESFTNWLTGPGGLANIADYMALPAAQREQLYRQWREFETQQQGAAGAMVERAKLEVAQPAPASAGIDFDRLQLSQSKLATISTLMPRVDLNKIAGGLAPTFNDIAKTGQFSGLPIPEALRPQLSDEEVRFLVALEDYADLVLRQRSGGQTAETELRRMMGFLGSGRMTPQTLVQSIDLQNQGMDATQRVLEAKFKANHWLVPMDTSFTKARKVLRQRQLPFDDTAVELFLQNNPGFQ